MMLNDIFYMYSNMDSSSQILLFLIVLVGLMLLSILVINAIINSKNKKYDQKFNPITKYEKVVKKENKPKVEVKKETKKEEILEEIKEEKPTKEEEIEVIEVISDDNSVEKISQLLEDNKSNLNPINLTHFEEDQEKNAIISYDELVKKAGSKKIIYKTQKATINEEIKEEKIEIKKENTQSKFKASKVISPIYGVQKNRMYQNTSDDEMIDIDDDYVNKSHNAEKEMKRDVEFLSSLKNFRNGLQ